jgi:hypothetical protein
VQVYLFQNALTVSLLSGSTYKQPASIPGFSQAVRGDGRSISSHSLSASAHFLAHISLHCIEA